MIQWTTKFLICFDQGSRVLIASSIQRIPRLLSREKCGQGKIDKASMFLLIALFSLGFAAPFVWKSCDPNSVFQVDSMTMAPYPARADQNVTTHAHGSQKQTVSGGTWTAVTSLDGIPVNTNNGNACDLIPGCPCPCASGSYTSVLSLPVPWFTPSGRYEGKFTATDQNGNSLSCISYQFDIQH